jgi:CheY-like chemotaxis protein
VLLEIEDDGPGMPAQTLGQIFDPYFSTKPDGTGLGLAIAHSVVRRHGGRITAESEPERGTRFRIALPASPSAAAVSPEPPPVSVGAEVASEPAAEPDPAVRAPRVLVMDDEQAIRRVVERLLERLGCETVGCAEGGEAIEAYRSALESGSPFHLVIMDLTVAGGMGGREAAKVILELDPEARVLVASGYSSDPVMGDPAKHGFAGALQKPFRKQDLEQALADLLRS